MSWTTRIIWIIFGLMVLAAAISRWVSEPDPTDDSGGMCAIMGFMILFVMIIGTIIERLTTKQKQAPRGFEVLPKDRETR